MSSGNGWKDTQDRQRDVDDDREERARRQAARDFDPEWYTELETVRRLGIWLVEALSVSTESIAEFLEDPEAWENEYREWLVHLAIEEEL